jgi:8-oxo-dGTP pyrophosphatase MutT (NUDIX family)
LPGGRQESGESSQQTALRELSEELNCDTNAIEMVGQLSDVYVYNSNFLVTPWVAVTGAALEFAPNPDEVADWFSLPLGEITSAPQITSKQIRRGPFHFSAPCFHWREYQIWGATSMILSELQCLLRNTLDNRLGDR